MKKTLNFIPILLGFFCILAYSSSASALIVDNGMTTLDTDTNLEWLDLSYTSGATHNQVFSSSFVVNDGYRVANELEIINLFQHFGVPVSYYSDILYLYRSNEQIYLDKVHEFYTLFDATITNSVNGFDELTWINYVSTTNGLYYTDDVSIYNNGSSAQFYIRTDGYSPTLMSNGDPAIQTFLVRDNQTAPVPEPSTVFLLGIGLSGLAWYGRKQKKA